MTDADDDSQDAREGPAAGIPEPAGRDPEDRTSDRDPHHALNNPVGEPDPTEWPDPYESREDPRDPFPEAPMTSDAQHTPDGATSTSEPHPSQDPEAPDWHAPQREDMDR